MLPFLSFLAATLMAIVDVVGITRRRFILIGLVCIGMSFVLMLYAFVTSDFSYALVAGHSHSDAPLLYRLTGLWGNHEGSLLLWMLVLWIYRGWLAFSQVFPETVSRAGGRVLSAIISVFSLYLLVLSSPFERLTPPAYEGVGLNPLLQDPALAAHPPFLYGGYVGFAAVYALCLGWCLVPGGLSVQAFAKGLRRFVLVPWALLTIGIGLGSFWAYYELGWGGFWFWDPVENASLLPWFVGTALLHSLLATQKNGHFATWSLALGLSAFCLSVLGLFLVRSGVITSVHAFAVDPERGIAILAILAGVLSAAVWAFHRGGGHLPKPLPRRPTLYTIVLGANNYGLTAACAIVCVGTLYPIVCTAIGLPPVSVGAPYYNRAVVPWLVGLVAIMGAAPFLGHDTLDRRMLQHRGEQVVLISLGLLIGFILGVPKIEWGSAMLLFIALLPISASLLHLGTTIPLHRRWGMAVAHIGVGILMIGIVAASLWQVQKTAAMHPGQRITVAENHITLLKVEPVQTPAYTARRASFLIQAGNTTSLHHAEQRAYTQANSMLTSEIGLKVRLGGDIYIALGDALPGGGWGVQVTYNPLQAWVWVGVLAIALGGGIAVWKRR
ncbi:MAG: heme lyase CcmF/NrfE family subunit [Holosporales bacterium]|jgi:cytochrome c-type biogenesis protein CcmF